MANSYPKGPLPGKLVFRTLGNTGLRVPVIGMGILSSGSPALINAALDAGITLLDSTAALQQQIRNEEMLGTILKGRARESIVYGTKIHLPQNFQTGLFEKTATEEEFTRLLDESLKRLKMDYVDILYNHMISCRESAFYEPVMNAMEKAKKSGKARFLGLTTHGNVPEAVQAATDSKFYEVVMAAYNPRQKNMSQVKDAVAHAASAGLGVIAIKIIRGDADKGQGPVNPAASLKWVLQDPNVHATVPGFSNFDEMTADLAVMEDLNLSDSEISDLKKEISNPGLFCQSCGQCLHQCKEGLPVPDLMRAYMYFYGYRQPALAHSLISSLPFAQKACNGCSSCHIECPNGWKVADKIGDILSVEMAMLKTS